MALIARQWQLATNGAEHVPRLRPVTACTMTVARLRLQGLLEPLRHQGIHHRGPEELLGRQVLGQVPQALDHGPQAGHRGPVRVPREADRGTRAEGRAAAARSCVVGMPRAMSIFDRYPFWHRYFTELGIEVVLSPRHRPEDRRRRRSNWRWRSPATRCRWRTGTCWRWSKQGVDYVLVPNMLNAETDECRRCTAHFCPWNQTLPFVLRSAPRLEEHRAQVPDAHAALPAGPRRR